MIEQHPLKAIGFFSAAVLLISVVDAVCKIYTTDLHAVQLVWGYFVGITLTLNLIVMRILTDIKV